jgi:hypothetical protein
LYRRIVGSGLLLGAALALVAACAAPGTNPGSMAPPHPGLPDPTATGTAAACPEPGVLIREGGSDAAMGLRVLSIELVNCGASPYAVNGYPTIRVFDADHKLLDVDVERGTTGISGAGDLNAGPTPLTLGPGQEAVATLAWRNTVTDSTVVATNGAYLEIAPADGQHPQVVTPKYPIDLGNTGRLGTTAWIGK